jgi:hypothetical protein
MAASTPKRVLATPPLEPLAAPLRGRIKKPSAKVQEAQQLLRTRAA